jgi:hypothetical protein
MSDRDAPRPPTNSSLTMVPIAETKTLMVRLSDIAVPPHRMRQLRPEVVDELAESGRADAQGVDHDQAQASAEGAPANIRGRMVAGRR